MKSFYFSERKGVADFRILLKHYNYKKILLKNTKCITYRDNDASSVVKQDTIN